MSFCQVMNVAQVGTSSSTFLFLPCALLIASTMRPQRIGMAFAYTFGMEVVRPVKKAVAPILADWHGFCISTSKQTNANGYE